MTPETRSGAGADATETRKAAVERFEQQVEWYARSAVHTQAASLARLVELAAPGPGERFLDVATGAGHTAAALKRAEPGLVVLASDLTPGMVRRARQDYGGLGVHFLQADAERLPVGSGRLDAVVSRSAPHHFPDIAAFLREVVRVLAPGGRLVVSDPSCVEDAEVDAWLHHAELVHDPSHVKNYRLREWRALVDASGLVWETGDAETRHTRVYSKWMQVVEDPRQVEELRATFLAAPEPVRNALEFRVDEARDPPEITYTVPQAIFRARKVSD